MIISNECLTCVFLLTLLTFAAANYTCKQNEVIDDFDEYVEHYPEYLCFDEDENGIALSNYSDTNNILLECRHLINPRVKFYNFIEEIDYFKDEVSLEFRSCPIPDEPFGDIFQSLNISSVIKINFTNPDQRNDNSFKLYHFRNLTGLQNLVIANTRIDLSENFFDGMQNLVELFLQNNSLQNLPREIFKNLTKLRILTIICNRLITLNEDIFRYNNELVLLDLSRNQLSTLSKNVFSNQTSLTDLSIEYNNFTTLPEDSLSDLVHLSRIWSRENHLRELPAKILDKNANLTILDLAYNKIDDLNGTLGSLKTLNLTGNCLKSINSDIFVDSILLEELDLSKTCLNYSQQNISDLRVCGKQSSLESLFINYNHFTTWPANLLKNCSKLKVLQCKGNFLQELSGEILKETPNLEELDLSYNRINSSDYKFPCLTNLVKLDLTGNRLQRFKSDVCDLTKLKELRLGGNCFKVIMEDSFSRLDNIVKIDLSNNPLAVNDFSREGVFPINSDSWNELILRNSSLTKVPYSLIRNSIKVQTVDLGYNNITSIMLSELYPSSSSSKGLLRLDLSNNQITTINGEAASDGLTIAINLKNNLIRCDCHIFESVAYVQQKNSSNYPTIKFEEAFCHWPKSLKNATLHNVTLSLLQCPLNDSHLKEKVKCPLKCNCQYRPVDKAVIIDCNGTGMDEFPDELQKNNHVKMELWFANNHLSSLDKLLNLSSTAHVSTLSLSNNILAEIQQLEHFHQLEVLQLDNNRITRMPSALIQRLRNFTTLTFITLHNNPWKCDCSTKEFKYFLKSVIDSQKLKNSINDITCQNVQQSIISMDDDLLCSNSSKQESVCLVIVYVSLVIFSILLAITIILYFIYEYEIRVWMFTHKICLPLVLKPEINEDKIYDAFISISAQDEAFVVDYLLPQLENNVDHGYKLFIESRHALTGGWIANQITNTVENSYRTIIVLSTNYLTNEWRRENYRTLHLNAIKDHSARVIVILLDGIKIEHLDPELKALLERKALKWGESFFWEKFKYELPHPQIYSKQRGARGTALQMRRLKN